MIWVYHPALNQRMVFRSLMRTSEPSNNVHYWIHKIHMTQWSVHCQWNSSSNLPKQYLSMIITNKWSAAIHLRLSRNPPYRRQLTTNDHIMSKHSIKTSKAEQSGKCNRLWKIRISFRSFLGMTLPMSYPILIPCFRISIANWIRCSITIRWVRYAHEIQWQMSFWTIEEPLFRIVNLCKQFYIYLLIPTRFLFMSVCSMNMKSYFSCVKMKRSNGARSLQHKRIPKSRMWVRTIFLFIRQKKQPLGIVEYLRGKKFCSLESSRRTNHLRSLFLWCRWNFIDWFA